MLEYRTIVWPNDFSDAAGRALAHVLSLSAKYDAKVHLIHVAPDLADYGRWWGEPSPEHVRHLHDFAVRKAQERLEAYCNRELRSCSGFEILVTYGDPAEEIVRLADRTKADIIVLGSRGMRGAHPLGSVTEKVLRTTTTAVLVAS